MYSVTKKFLTQNSSILDDSYISTAIAVVAGAVRAGISIHDGNHVVTFQWCIPIEKELQGESLKIYKETMQSLISSIKQFCADVEKELAEAGKKKKAKPCTKVGKIGKWAK